MNNNNSSILLDEKKAKEMMWALNAGDMSFHQFYNLDFKPDEFAFQNFMTSFIEGDSVIKVLNKTYYDIEVHYEKGIFPEAERADYMINAIAVYNNILNKAVIYTIPTNSNITDKNELTAGVRELYGQKCLEKPEYTIPGLDLEVQVFSDEGELLKTFFSDLIKLDTLFLIGFNSSGFDDPYVVNRGLKIVGPSIFDYISEFKQVKKFSEKTYDWPDYIKVDLLKLYKPIDQGGKGFGSSLPSYSLNSVAKKELNLNKLDIEDMNASYLNNIVEFLTYNLLDTLLTFKIDQKLKSIELSWMLTKYNTSPIGKTFTGRSLMYLYRNNLIYTKQGKLMRVKKFISEISNQLQLQLQV